MADATSIPKLVTKKLITLTFENGQQDTLVVREDLGDQFDVTDDHYALQQPRLRRYAVWRIDMVRSCDDRTVEVPESDTLTPEQQQEKTRSPYDFELK